MNPSSIVFISGWGGDRHVWDGVCERLAASFSLHHVEWWECLDGRRPPGPAMCVGWSLGGLLALSAAFGAPEDVSALVLVSSTARLCSAEGYAAVPGRLLRAMRLKLRESPEAVLGDFWERAFAPVEAPPRVARLAARAAALPKDRLDAGLRRLEGEDLRARLPELTMPALVVHGEADQIVPHQSGAYLAGHLPRGRLVTVSGCGHALPHCAPGILTEQIERFANELRG